MSLSCQHSHFTLGWFLHLWKCWNLLVCHSVVKMRWRRAQHFVGNARLLWWLIVAASAVDASSVSGPDKVDSNDTRSGKGIELFREKKRFKLSDREQEVLAKVNAKIAQTSDIQQRKKGLRSSFMYLNQAYFLNITALWYTRLLWSSGALSLEFDEFFGKFRQFFLSWESFPDLILHKKFR